MFLIWLTSLELKAEWHGLCRYYKGALGALGCVFEVL